jgi:hypothetical protein
MLTRLACLLRPSVCCSDLIRADLIPVISVMRLPATHLHHIGFDFKGRLLEQSPWRRHSDQRERLASRNQTLRPSLNHSRYADMQLNVESFIFYRPQCVISITTTNLYHIPRSHLPRLLPNAHHSSNVVLDVFLHPRWHSTISSCKPPPYPRTRRYPP